MPKTDHPIEREELMEYLDGELPADRAGMAAGHLERCRECQELAADLQTVSRRMTEWQVEASETEIAPGLLGALGESRKRGRPATRRWLFGLTVAGLATLAVVAVLPTNSKHAMSPPPSMVRTARYFSAA